MYISTAFTVVVIQSSLDQPLSTNFSNRKLMPRRHHNKRIVIRFFYLTTTKGNAYFVSFHLQTNMANVSFYDVTMRSPFGVQEHWNTTIRSNTWYRSYNNGATIVFCIHQFNNEKSNISEQVTKVHFSDIVKSEVNF